MQTITKDQHLQALGLFTLVVQHARQAEAARQGLARLLGRDAKLLGGMRCSMIAIRRRATWTKR